MDPLNYYLREFIDWSLTQVPLIAVWAVAAVLAIILWRRHARVSMLVLIAVAVCLIAFLLDGFMTVRLPRFIIENRLGAPNAEGWRAVAPGTVLRAAQFLVATVYATAWALATGALFGWRRAPAPAAVKTPADAEPQVQPQPAH